MFDVGSGSEPGWVAIVNGLRSEAETSAVARVAVPASSTMPSTVIDTGIVHTVS